MLNGEHNMSETKNPKKFIIDTDPGIDDAMAIMMALDAHKRGLIEVVAITLVNGNASIKHGEINVLRVLEVLGMEDSVSTFNI